MNHTHYALINEDNDVVAVINREDYSPRLLKAIEDETGTTVVSMHTKEIDYQNFEVSVVLDDGCNYRATLRPTWMY